MKHKVILLILLAGIISPSLSLGQGYGNYAFSFLQEPVTARLAALGSNVAAINDNDINIAFANKADYDKILEDDTFDVKGMKDFIPGKDFTVVINHADGTADEIKAKHSYNENQIEWFKSGSALNLIRKQNS